MSEPFTTILQACFGKDEQLAFEELVMTEKESLLTGVIALDCIRCCVQTDVTYVSLELKHSNKIPFKIGETNLIKCNSPPLPPFVVVSFLIFLCFF